jgi:hypothetical protein
MKKTLMTGFSGLVLLASLNGYAAEMQKVEPIKLNIPKDVQDAAAMQTALESVVVKVMDCANKKLAQPKDCFCLYPTELSQAKKVYESTLNLHPNWRDKVIFWWRDDNHSSSYNLSFAGLKQQFAQKCPVQSSNGTH